MPGRVICLCYGASYKAKSYNTYDHLPKASLNLQISLASAPKVSVEMAWPPFLTALEERDGIGEKSIITEMVESKAGGRIFEKIPEKPLTALFRGATLEALKQQRRCGIIPWRPFSL